MFANQPELLEMTGPDGLPAEVIVVPKDQTGPEAVADQLRAEFPTARSVKNDNKLLSRITGPKYTAPTCPPSGERPADHVT
jgi:cell division protein FtsX